MIQSEHFEEFDKHAAGTWIDARVGRRRPSTIYNFQAIAGWRGTHTRRIFSILARRESKSSVGKIHPALTKALPGLIVLASEFFERTVRRHEARQHWRH